MAEQAYAYVTLIPVAKGFQQAVAKEMGGITDTTGKIGKEAGGRFSGGFGQAVRGLGGIVAGGLAAVGAGRFFSGAVREASDLGESLNAVSVSYGDAAGGIIQLGENAAKGLGLSQNQFNSIATQFSGFAGTIAGEGGDVVGFIDELSTRGADFASVFNMDVDQALGLFQSGLAGEAEPLRRFGIDLSAATVEAFAYANGIAEAGEPLTEQQKQQARYGSLLEQTTKVQGDFSNTSDSLANSQRILQASFADMQAEVGQAVVPALASLSQAMMPLMEELGPVLTEVMQALAPVFADLAAQLPGLLTAFIPMVPVLGELAGLFLEIVTAVLPILVSVLTNVISGLSTLFQWISQNRNALMPWVIALGAFLVVMKSVQLATIAYTAVTKAWSVVTKIARGIQLAFNLVMMANPIMLVVAAIAALVAGLIWFFTQTEAGKEAWAAFTGFLSDLWDGIVIAFQGLLEHFAALWEWFKGVPQLIMDALAAAGNFLLDVGKNILQGLWDGILFVWELIKFWYIDMPMMILGWLGDAATWLLDIGKNIIQGLWDGIKAIWEFVKWWYLDMPKIILGWLAGAATWLLNIGKDIIQGMWDGILFIWDSVTTWFGGLFDLVIGFFSDAGTWLYNVGRDILQGLWDGLLSLWDRIVDWMGGLGDAIADKFRWVLDIFSPSKVFYGFGQNIGEGLLLGMQSMEGALDAEVATMLTVPKPDTVRAANMQQGRMLNYYAAPNKSFDAEQELRLAMTRARVLA